MIAGQTPVRIVTIGPECTGKTSLARFLAAYYGVPWSEEYARLFVDAHPRPVTFDDVEAIGRGQVALEDAAVAEAVRAGSGLVVHDTDLISTDVYCRHYYGGVPAWIPPLALARRADLYLLHHADVPWTADGFQRLEPERREELFQRFADTLAAARARVVAIRGDWARRQAAAIAAIEHLDSRGFHVRAVPGA